MVQPLKIQNELDIIQFLRLTQPHLPYEALGLHDDAALLKSDSHQRVIASDLISENIHFNLDLGGQLIGQKAVLVNLSDLSAMGALPESLLINLTFPPSLSSQFLTELLNGIVTTASSYGLSIIGGDTSRGASLTIGITIIGCLPEGCSTPLMRSSSEDSHYIAITGPLGGSLINDRHASFTPCIEQGQLLIHQKFPCAVMDISDGIASDLPYIMQSSSISGAILTVDSFPIHPSIQHLPPQQSIQRFLCDGEDFELLLTFSPEHLDHLQSSSLSLYIIGYMSNMHDGIWLKYSDGTLSPLHQKGFLHSL